MGAGVDAFKYSGGVPANDPAWRVVIVLGRSRRVLVWVVVVTLAGLAALAATSLPVVGKAFIALVLGTAAVGAVRRQAWQIGARAIRCFVTDLAGRVDIELADGSRVRGRALPGSFVAPWLVIVRWLPDGARFSHTILVAPDAVGDHEWRRLRVLLRWR